MIHINIVLKSNMQAEEDSRTQFPTSSNTGVPPGIHEYHLFLQGGQGLCQMQPSSNKVVKLDVLEAFMAAHTKTPFC